MSWTEQPFEKKMFERLTFQFSEALADEHYSRFKVVRNQLIKDIYPEISGTEPNLTKHDPSHIADVMKSVDRVIGDRYEDLSGMDLYFLGLIIIFHDSGNIEGREDHHTASRIKHIYDSTLASDKAKYRQERKLVSRAAQAHSSGKNIGLDADTIKDLPVNDGIDGFDIKVQEMAVILRLSDELSEGPHRTSSYKINNALYDSNSRIYHEYAQITHIHIDRGTNRIALTYNIEYQNKEQLEKLLEFTYRRIHKLDQERKYARHYSRICSVFNKTTVAINIESIDGKELVLNNCVLTDLTVPGEQYKALDQLYDNYKIQNIVSHFDSKI